jgi:hypothetical protein
MNSYNALRQKSFKRLYLEENVYRKGRKRNKGLNGNKKDCKRNRTGEVIDLTLKEYKLRAVVVVSQVTKNDEELEMEHQARTGTYEIDKRKKIGNQMLCKREAFFALK